MKKRWLAIAAIMILGACILVPKPGYTEDRDTVLLARAIYALARDDSYDAKLAVGTLAMNRVENPWFGNTLRDVLNEQHQFPIGSRYDSDSLSAAHAVLSGRRTLSAGALYYQTDSASEPRRDAPVKTVGHLAFYSTDTDI